MVKCCTSIHYFLCYSHKTLFAQLIDTFHLVLRLQSHDAELDEIQRDKCPTYSII